MMLEKYFIIYSVIIHIKGTCPVSKYLIFQTFMPLFVLYDSIYSEPTQFSPAKSLV